MKNSKFKPLASPVYQPKPLTYEQARTCSSASAWLKSQGFSAIDGSPVTAATRTRRPRLARIARDSSKLTLDI